MVSMDVPYHQPSSFVLTEKRLLQASYEQSQTDVHCTPALQDIIDRTKALELRLEHMEEHNKATFEKPIHTHAHSKSIRLRLKLGFE